MQRLNTVAMEWDTETTVTLTVRVDRRGARRGGAERRLEEVIAAHVWMALHEPATVPPSDELEP